MGTRRNIVVFINPEIYNGVILPILIFLARIYDVSMDTNRVFFLMPRVSGVPLQS
jgi:hypothetical protein